MKTSLFALVTLFAGIAAGPAEVRSDSPEIAILSASYGVDDHRIDATATVRSLLVHGIALIRAPWALGGDDPAPDQVKDVQVVYRFNGAKQTATFTQDQDIILPSKLRGLTIVSARFGVAERRVDVTEALRAQAGEDGTIQLGAGWFLGSVDPAFGTVKDVEIVYLEGGKPHTATFTEEEDILLPKKISESSRASEPVTQDIAGWGKSVNPGADCKFFLEDDQLLINVPGGEKPHDLAAEIGVTNAPRVLQPVRGDFVMQAKVEGRFAPGDQSTLPGRTGYNGAGLVLMADAKNVVCLARAVLQREGGDPTHYANFEIRVDGDLQRIGETGDFPLPETGPVYLRIERRNQKILGAVSEDGTHWHELAPKELPSDWPDELQAGVAAISTSKEEFNPRFSKLQILK